MLDMEHMMRRFFSSLLPQVLILSAACELAASEPKVEVTWVEYELSSANPEQDQLRAQLKEYLAAPADANKPALTRKLFAAFQENQRPSLEMKMKTNLAVGGTAKVSAKEGSATLSVQLECTPQGQGKYKLRANPSFVEQVRGGRRAMHTQLGMQVKPGKSHVIMVGGLSVGRTGADGRQVTTMSTSFMVVCLETSD